MKKCYLFLLFLFVSQLGLAQVKYSYDGAGNRVLRENQGTSNGCAFSLSPSGGGTVNSGSPLTLSANCSGSDCGSVTYVWSGNGISGTGSTVSFNAPTTPGTYSYAVTAHKNNCTDQTVSVNVTVNSTGVGPLVSGSCYTIKSLQTTFSANTLQAVSGLAQFQTSNSQNSQIWMATSVGSQYYFTSQDGSGQSLYVDAFGNGQALKVGTYQAIDRYQWTLGQSSNGGYRVYGGSSQNTWDHQSGGAGNTLQLYGSNTSQGDGDWDQPYRRFSFTSVGCPGSNNLTVSPGTVNSVASSGSSQAITVSSNVGWTVSTNSFSWLSVSSSSGSGNGGFTLSVASNSGAARNGSVTVTGGGITQTINVSQLAGGTSGGSLVSGNCYTIKSQQVVSANNTAQAVGSQVQFQAPVANQSNQIWLATGVGSQYYFTVQDGSNQSMYVDALGDGQPLRLGGYSANERFQWNLAASSNVGYRVYGGSGQNTWDQANGGSSTLLQLYGTNTNTGDGNWDQPFRRFSFTSVGCPGSSNNLSVSPGTVNSVASSGGSQAITVSSNVGWTVSTNSFSWLSVSSSSGSGNGGFTLSVASNSGAARNGSVTVTGGGTTQTINVSQLAGGTTGGPLVSGSCYTIKSQQVVSGNNTAQAVGSQVQFQAPVANQSNQIWLATGVGSQYYFTVQDGSNQSMYVDAFSNGQALKLGTYQAIDRYQWNAVSSSNGGYRVYGGSGQNTWDQASAGTSPLLQLYGSETSHESDWDQPYRRFSFTSVGCPGTSSNLSVNPGSVNSVASSGGSQAITVTSNVGWSVNTNGNSWLTVSSSSGSGNGGFTISVSSNSGAVRNGSVSVTGGGLTQTITVNQLAGGTSGGPLVSGNCYTIKSQQVVSGNNTAQAVGSQVQFQPSVANQSNQIWLATGVGSQYYFTVQDGSNQSMYVDALGDGQPLRLGGYSANERFQWNLAASSNVGYRVYGGSGQNTWDQANGGSSTLLQLYGTNTNTGDGNWDQPFRRFSFTSVGCPGTTSNLTVSPTTITNVASSGGSQAITVSSNVGWSVSTNGNSWLSVSSSSGSGNGGFTLSVASNSGAARSGNVTVTGGSITQTISVNQLAGTTVAGNYDGYLDGVNCGSNLIYGWVWDSNQPNTSLLIDILDNGNVVASGFSANSFRQDLANAGKGNGNHGYYFQIPSSLRDGQVHPISVRVSGTSYTLNNSPTTLQCTGSARKAAVEEATVIVSPNPVQDEITVNWVSNAKGTASFHLYSAIGSELLVQTVEAQAGSNQTTMNVKSLQAGVILLEIHQGNQRLVKKLIKL